MDSIIRDENSILTVSTPVPDYYDIRDVCLSLPCVINEGGIETVLYIPLKNEEEEALKQTATRLKKIEHGIIGNNTANIYLNVVS